MLSIEFMLLFAIVSAFICIATIYVTMKLGIIEMSFAFGTFLFTSLSYSLWYALLLHNPSYLSFNGLEELRQHHDLLAEFIFFLAAGDRQDAIRYVSRYPVFLTLFSISTSSMMVIIKSRRRIKLVRESIVMVQNINN